MSFTTMFDAELARYRAAQEVLEEIGTSNSKLDAKLKELDAQQQLHIEALAAERAYRKENSVTTKIAKKFTVLRRNAGEAIEETIGSDD